IGDEQRGLVGADAIQQDALCRLGEGRQQAQAADEKYQDAFHGLSPADWVMEASADLSEGERSAARANWLVPPLPGWRRQAPKQWQRDRRPRLDVPERNPPLLSLPTQWPPQPVSGH